MQPGAQESERREVKANFDEALIKSEMAIIEQRFEDERRKLKDATQALAKREARAYLAISFNEPDLLTNEKAKEYLSKAGKLTVDDKKYLLALEVEAEQIAYDLAKFDCDTSRQHYDKLQPQLSFLQSEMKLT